MDRKEMDVLLLQKRLDNWRKDYHRQYAEKVREVRSKCS